MAFQLYAIASGHDQTLNSLSNIETISVNGYKFVVVGRARGSYKRGRREITGRGGDAWNGYQTTQWVMAGLFYAQLTYLRDTYCGGEWSGEVTIYTTLGGDTYYRCNATMRLDNPGDADGYFYAVKNYPIRMTRIVVLA